MLTLRLILVWALVAQLTAAYRCCPSHAQCELPDDTQSCCSMTNCCSSVPVAATCCSNASDDCDEPGDRSSCPCCSAHLLESKEPMDGLPASDGPSLSFLTFPALAPAYAQPDDTQVDLTLQARPLRARPTIERLAQLSVWRN